MYKQNLKFILGVSTLVFLTSLFLMSCMGCGGVKKGDTIPIVVDQVKINEESNSEVTTKESIDPLNKQFTNNPNTIYVAKKEYGEEILKTHNFRYYPENYGIAINKNLNTFSKIFKYDSNYNVIFDVNMLEKNPYISKSSKNSSISNIQQLDGIHEFVNKSDFLNDSNQLFTKSLENSTNDLHLRINSNTFIQKDNFLSVGYFYQILPYVEILEFVPTPTITTLEIYEKGKLLVTFNDLPFHVEEIQITQNGKYAVIVHQEPITNKNYSPEIWNHCFSVYDISSKKLCFRKKIENQFSSGLVGKENNIVTVGFEEFKPNKKPISINYYIRGEKKDIVEWIIDHNKEDHKKYKHITQEGILFTLPDDNKLHLLEFDSNFNTIKLK